MRKNILFCKHYIFETHNETAGPPGGRIKKIKNNLTAVTTTRTQRKKIITLVTTAYAINGLCVHLIQQMVHIVHVIW